MCLIIGLGLLFIAGGASVATQGDVPIGIITCVTGLWILSIGINLGLTDRIDVSVRNKVVARDGYGRYLVEADTSRQIVGPRPHVTGNLPAGLYQVRDGLWVVDSSGTYLDRKASEINWQPVDGNYHIEPRGNTSTGGFLRDVMEGYDHNYIVEDK